MVWSLPARIQAESERTRRIPERGPADSAGLYKLTDCLRGHLLFATVRLEPPLPGD